MQGQKKIPKGVDILISHLSSTSTNWNCLCCHSWSYEKCIWPLSLLLDVLMQLRELHNNWFHNVTDDDVGSLYDEVCVCVCFWLPMIVWRWRTRKYRLFRVRDVGDSTSYGKSQLFFHPLAIIFSPFAAASLFSRQQINREVFLKGFESLVIFNVFFFSPFFSSVT